jgi:hypothetical protein
VSDSDPRQALAHRLRALREEHWPGKKVNQSQLAAALGGDERRPVSVPLISAWESRTNPRVPPEARIRDIATFFASPRSFDGHTGRLLSPDEMTVQEKADRQQLLQELSQLRSEARDAHGSPPGLTPSQSEVQDIAESLSAGPYHFRQGKKIIIVCAQLPHEMLRRMPYTDPLDPDFIELYRYSDLDALFELFGHLRAANPTSQVEFRAADQLSADDYSRHLVSLGGVDWNDATTSVLERLELPVKQVNDWDKEGGVYFEVPDENGRPVIHRPRLDTWDGRAILREDVALFARAVSPFNRERFVMICNGMYGRGTYGAVRALTDEGFRNRNNEYIQARFSDSEAYCILTRVTVEASATLTPDWTLPATRLFEWSKPR